MTSTSNAPSSIDVRPVSEDDREWVRALIGREWGSSVVVSRGRLHDPATLPGLVALVDRERAGLATYRIDGGECEVVSGG